MPAGGPATFARRYLEKQLLLRDGSGGVPGFRRDASAPMLILMAMAGLVLLIACANVANLLTARAASRQKEIAVRLALGAGRLQLIRQLMVESALLAGAGAVAGLLLASWTLEVLRSLMGSSPGAATLAWQLDARALAFMSVAALASGLAFGLLPALQATGPNLAPSLKDTGVLSATRIALRSKRVLVVAQVALSLLLLIVSGLFVRSLANLQTLDPGFRVEHLITFNVDAPLSGYKLDQAPLVYSALQDRFAALPGVGAVAIAENSLMSGANWQMTVSVQGYQRKEGEDMNPVLNTVSERFFAGMGFPLTQGREFAAADTAAAPKVAIVNEVFARYFFGPANPLGRRIGFGHDQPGIEIVGVVNDGRMSSLREEPRRRIYVPVRQGLELGQVAFYVRTINPPGPMIQDAAPGDGGGLPWAGLLRCTNAGGRDLRIAHAGTAGCHTLRRIRRRGHSAGRVGSLRRHGSVRRATHAGTRHPGRARRQPRQHPQHGAQRGGRPGRDRHCHRLAAVAVSRAIGAHAAVRPDPQ